MTPEEVRRKGPRIAGRETRESSGTPHKGGVRVHLHKFRSGCRWGDLEEVGSRHGGRLPRVYMSFRPTPSGADGSYTASEDPYPVTSLATYVLSQEETDLRYLLWRSLTLRGVRRSTTPPATLRPSSTALHPPLPEGQPRRAGQGPRRPHQGGITRVEPGLSPPQWVRNDPLYLEPQGPCGASQVQRGSGSRPHLWRKRKESGRRTDRELY